MAKNGETMASLAMKESPWLTPEDVAAVIGSSRQYISIMTATAEGREALGFRVIRIGTETKIPRIPFLRFMGWEGPIVGSGAEA